MLCPGLRKEMRFPQEIRFSVNIPLVEKVKCVRSFPVASSSLSLQRALLIPTWKRIVIEIKEMERTIILYMCVAAHCGAVLRVAHARLAKENLHLFDENDKTVLLQTRKKKCIALAFLPILAASHISPPAFFSYVLLYPFWQMSQTDINLREIFYRARLFTRNYHFG